MSATLARICRHPVKSLGEEEIGEVTLTPGQHMPWDRVWAVAHGSSDFDGSWTEPRNFVHQARSPKLAQVGVRYDEAAGRLHLSHPDLAPLDVDPAGEAEVLADWIAPLASSLQQGPFRLAEMAEGRFCDFPDTHLSLATEPSRRALGQMAGQDLHPVRFRMNLWLEGTAPWEELDWEGQSIEIGPVRLEITARDTRCAATSASPATGARDIEIPALLHQQFGHKDFGVYATVTRGGTIRVGDQVTLPA